MGQQVEIHHHMLPDQILGLAVGFSREGHIHAQGRTKLSLFMQALTSNNYVNYHTFKVDGFSMASCRFCGEGHEEFIHLACKCPSLTFKHLGVLYVLELWS